MRTRRLLTAFVLAAGMGLVSGCMQAVSPATGRTFTTSVSESQEAQIGAKEHPKILAEYGGAYDEKPEVNRYVDSVGQFVATTSERRDVKYTFTVLDAPEINAFALPGGYVYITRGLLGLAVNEAEIAGVLGHEIGHVNARHTAERIGQSQKAQLGVLAGVLLGAVLGGEQGAQIGGQFGTELAENYLGQYSQDQEFEADMLGVRYMRRANYDPQAMASFLNALNADTHLEARLAGDESTADTYNMKQSHPRTADRVQRAIDTAGPSVAGAITARDNYLARVDGIMFGDNPAQGVVKGRDFIHPSLRLAFTVPEGFHIHNQPEKVVAQADNGAIVFDMAPAGVGDLGAYVQGQWNPKATVSNVQRVSINGMEAATGIAEGTVSKQPATFRLLAVRFVDNRVYRFLFAAPKAAFARMDNAFGATANSFRQVSAAEAGSFRARHIHVVKVGTGDTVESLAAGMALDEARVDWFRVLNRLDPGQPLVPGQLVKVVGY